MNKLSNGIIMPPVSIGTNWMDYKSLLEILTSAFNAGFRAIDTARDYGNEPIVGQALADALRNCGLKREDIFITTKIGNGQQIDGNINNEINISLDNLRTDYVDLWLMHWPYPNYFHSTWNAMERIYSETHYVKAIGVANFEERHFISLLKNCSVIPMVNQIEFHPLRTVDKLRKYMEDNNIALQAYTPFCRFVPQIKNNKELAAIVKNHDKTLGQILLRWHLQNKSMPVFKSYNPKRFIENADIFDFNLSEMEMNQISALNINYKYHLESASCPGF